MDEWSEEAAGVEQAARCAEEGVSLMVVPLAFIELHGPVPRRLSDRRGDDGIRGAITHRDKGGKEDNPEEAPTDDMFPLDKGFLSHVCGLVSMEENEADVCELIASKDGLHGGSSPWKTAGTWRWRRSPHLGRHLRRSPLGVPEVYCMG